jgi:hypothetical protein
MALKMAGTILSFSASAPRQVATDDSAGNDQYHSGCDYQMYLPCIIGFCGPTNTPLGSLRLPDALIFCRVGTLYRAARPTFPPHSLNFHIKTIKRINPMKSIDFQQSKA